MSMSCHVLSNQAIDSASEWQRHIDEPGFSLTIRAVGDRLSFKGHLPAEWNGMEGGFECFKEPVDEFVDVYRQINFGGPWSHLLSLYYSEIPSCAGAIIAAAVYAKATNGILFEPQEGIVYTADDAIAYARRNEAEVEELLRRIADAGGLDEFAQTLKQASKRT